MSPAALRTTKGGKPACLSFFDLPHSVDVYHGILTPGVISKVSETSLKS